MEFDANDSVAAAAVRSADDLIGIVKRKLGVDLDYTDASLRHVESFADSLHRALPPESERTASIQNTFRVFSEDMRCYIGEVLRRNHAAVWGWPPTEAPR